jgi:hypothetical protein
LAIGTAIAEMFLYPDNPALRELLLRRFIANASPNKWVSIATEPTDQTKTGGEVAYLSNRKGMAIQRILKDLRLEEKEK